MEFTNKFKGHQGDVQIFSINKVPSDAIKKEKTFFAASERSGHVHALTGDYDLYEINNGFVVKVGDKGAILNHTQSDKLTKAYWDLNEETAVADHKPTHLDKGVYYVGIQKKFDPFKNTWNNVKD